MKTFESLLKNLSLTCLSGQVGSFRPVRLAMRGSGWQSPPDNRRSLVFM